MILSFNVLILGFVALSLNTNFFSPGIQPIKSVIFEIS